MERQKNNFKSKHLYFLSLAFEQAKINLGSTSKNPSVGCVIEKKGAIISSLAISLTWYEYFKTFPLGKRNDIIIINKNIIAKCFKYLSARRYENIVGNMYFIFKL